MILGIEYSSSLHYSAGRRPELQLSTTIRIQLHLADVNPNVIKMLTPILLEEGVFLFREDFFKAC